MRGILAVLACLLGVQAASASESIAAQLMSQKSAYWDSKRAAGLLPRKDLRSSVMAPQTCTGGSVTINGESFPCSNVDFESFLSISDLFISAKGGTTAMSDIWGYKSPVTGKEITIVCVDNGVWFIDTTNPSAPKKLANMPTTRVRDSWCDVKVYKNVAYVVKDGRETSATQTIGIEVFDLTRLDSLTGSSVVSFTPNFTYRQHGKSHNLVINTETGFLYSVGSSTCSGGLHMVNLNANPLQPTFAGCVSSDGYVHDAQCVIYSGPHTEFVGREICFAYNVDALTIWDVTDKNSVQTLSSKGYTTSRYTHQGWLTKDMKYVLLNDELDEQEGAVSTTRTYIVDVSNLRSPVFVDFYTNGVVSIDHNLYVWGAIHERGWGGSGPITDGSAPSSKFAYLSNYVSGLRVVDIQDPLEAVEVGFFDVSPDLTGNIFDGAWSNYMHPSGVVVVSAIERGLFVLRPRMVFDPITPTPGPTQYPTVPPVNTPYPTLYPTTSPTDCADQVPSGLVYSGTNIPAPCDEIGQYCSQLAIVRERCPETCGLCASACADKVPSGLSYSNGQPAPCSEIGSYCSFYDFVQEACPATCNLCGTTFLKEAEQLQVELPTFIEDPSQKTVRAQLMNTKASEWNNLIAQGKLPRPNTFSVKSSPQTCTGGQVVVGGEVFPCDGIDFLSFMSLSDLFIEGKSGTNAGSDIWGWQSPNTGREVTIMGVNNGVNFIDSTDPTNPVVMGSILTGRQASSWFDAKVYKNVVYIVKDSGFSANYGIEVFDLLHLDELDPADYPVDLTPDFVYREHGNSHNLVINTESGFLYSVGSNTCSGGLHMVNLQPNPLQPTFAGCVSGDGYTHDAQCVIYTGPDTQFAGHEICFAFNEDTVTIWDVTVKNSPVRLARKGYAGSSYTHQGWLAEGMAYLLLDDELDEMDGVVAHTRTYLWDVSSLTAPKKIGKFDHPEVAIDHNLYVWGSIHKHGWGGNAAMTNPPSIRYAYLSNYVAGLKVMDICNIANGQISQKAFFDVSPDLSGNLFEGTWSNYMHPSGTLAVSSIDRGLFFLKFPGAFDTSPCVETPPTESPTTSPTDCTDSVPSGIVFSGGVSAPCSELAQFCDVYPIVSERCPETCGECGETTCEDSFPSGLTYSNGQPAPCSEIGIYCTVHPLVPVNCPATCGLCARRAAVSNKAIGVKELLIELPVAAAEPSEKKVLGDNILLLVAGVLGTLCVALGGIVVAVTRRVKKTAHGSEIVADVAVENAVEEPYAAPPARVSINKKPSPTQNPMFGSE